MHQNTSYLYKDAKKVLLKLIKPAEKVKVRGGTSTWTAYMVYTVYIVYTAYTVYCLQ